MVAKKKAGTPSRKRGYHHGDLRNALIDAALAEISSNGAHSLSLREVARRAGVSHAASYRHFRSKEDLLAAIAEQGFMMLSQALQSALDQHPEDAVAALNASGVAYVEFGVGHPEHLQVMFGGIFGGFDQWPSLQKAAQHAYELLRGSVRKTLESGTLHGDEETIAVAAWSLVHGLTQLIAGGELKRGRQSPRGLAQTVTALLVKGLRVKS
jgi:AcrR family transcriptional regulator